MKTLIVYDSYFGNTEKIARAICTSLDSLGDVQIFRVSEVRPDQLAGVDFLIVGSPTRAFRPSPAIQAYLKGLPKDALTGLRVAAFDTRINPEETNSAFLRFMVKLFGYAAKPIANQLAKKGGQLVAPPDGFYVKDTEGPLKEGEMERAANWLNRSLNPAN